MFNLTSNDSVFKWHTSVKNVCLYNWSRRLSPTALLHTIEQVHTHPNELVHYTPELVTEVTSDILHIVPIQTQAIKANHSLDWDHILRTLANSPDSILLYKSSITWQLCCYCNMFMTWFNVFDLGIFDALFISSLFDIGQCPNQ